MTIPTRFLLRLLLLPIALSAFTFAHGADWPMLRADAARSGYTAEPIPNQLSQRWKFKLPHPPRPSWPTAKRMKFDLVYQPIIMGDRVIFGSSSDDQVYALDANTGRVIWSFFTDAPIRFAPAGWQDRVFVASDDGHLYALSLTDGKLLWKHRGGPGGESVIGNERMTSKWPARGGPVVFGDAVYYAAGVWPSDGVFLHALDAATGEAIWTNDKTGQMMMGQPHGGAEAYSGVSAQGALVATADKLFVPTGRAVPAAYDRATGKFLYYHLQKNNQRGGARVMALDEYMFNDGCVFDAASGDLSFQLGHGATVSVPGGMVRAESRSLTAYKWATVYEKNKQGKFAPIRRLTSTRLISTDREILDFIVAGRDAVCGEEGRVSAIDYAGQRTIWWSSPVVGKALGLAAANGRLVVSTDEGFVYCFDGEPGKAIEATPKLIAAKSAGRIDYAKAAEEIVRRTGVREGFCLDLGAGEGDLAIELAKRTSLHIYAVEPDPKRVAIARQRLAAAGLYGDRVTVHQGSLDKVSYPDYFANLVVSSRSLEGRLSRGAVDEAKRMQRPYGGKSCLGRSGSMKVSTRGELAGAGNWTHQNSNPANTLCSDDAIVKGTLSMFWFRDVEFEIPNRHGQGPAPLFNKGNMVVGGVHGIACLDAYNGRLRWTYDVPEFLVDYDGIHHDVGVGDTGGPFCLGEAAAYVRHGDRCLRIGYAAGRLLHEFKTPAKPGEKHRDWGFLAYHNGILFGSTANADHSVSPRYKLTRLRTESTRLFAFDAATGKMLWQYDAQHSIRHNAIAIAGSRVYLIDRPLVKEDRITDPKRNGRHLPKLKADQVPAGALLALDSKTGRELWRNEENIIGTQLATSEKHSVLLMNFSAVRHRFFKLPSEVGDSLAAFDTKTGKRLWEKLAKYETRPVINDEIIYAQGGAWNLKTGESEPFDFKRSYGCGQIASGKHMMLYRSATLGYMDLTRGSGTENFGGIRPGCWINAIPVGGLVLIPDGSSKCRCSYQMQAWFALQERK
jgi:outer membrane protein assembly factor BamB